MKKSVAITLGLCMAASLVATKPCSAGFAVGGENGWQLTTDGIIDVFSYYETTTPIKGGSGAVTSGGLLDTATPNTQQRFGVGVGLLPSVVAINIKAPTTNGVDSSVRIGLYPSISNASENTPANTNGGATRFSTGSHLDVREIFYTAKGKYGEILAGRALNLYQGKNILTDMTLLTAGTIGARSNTVTLGHIGYGYLYANFGPQLRYTTPDFGGVKFAIAVGEPYNISTLGGDKTNLPRIEAELSFAKTFNSGANVQAWLSGLWQQTTGTNLANEKIHPQSVGGAYGIGGGFRGLNLLFSGYGGRGLGMVSAQDGSFWNDIAGVLTSGSTDINGKPRQFWGFLAQATYQINPSWMVGINYGQNRLIETSLDETMRTVAVGGFSPTVLCKRQESGVATVTYNMNKFTQFVLEYIHARDSYVDGAHSTSNQVAFGTMFYW